MKVVYTHETVTKRTLSGILIIMKTDFREFHLFQLLRIYDQESLPLDKVIHRYFQVHHALGSKDRGFIAERVYGMVRWQGLLDFLSEPPVSWEKRYTVYKDIDPSAYLLQEDIPLHVRLSFPPFLFQRIAESHGEAKAIEICIASNRPAPTTVRVNSLKTTRDSLLKKWLADGYDVIPCQHAHWGITFQKKIALFSLPEFRKGDFEVQDEGSQLLADLVGARPGDLVMDYCAGSGGKTLAFAPPMQNKGQIFLHDVRIEALQESRKRLRRAGIQNGQIIAAEDEKLKKLKKKMDWVLVDAPCSGTGTLRRNPDMKWRLEPETITRLAGQQRRIFEKALSFVKPGGKIVYATCSLLSEENERQVEHFLKTYPVVLEKPPFISLPTEGGMDGFFGAQFRFIQRPDCL